MSSGVPCVALRALLCQVQKEAPKFTLSVLPRALWFRFHVHTQLLNYKLDVNLLSTPPLICHHINIIYLSMIL